MTVIIAEAGENHCGDMEMAKKLIDVAARAGADYAKFQLYDASRVSDDDPEKEWFEHVQLNEEKLLTLVEHSQSRNIKPLCTPWAIDNAELILRSGIDAMKIASFHTTDLELLRFVNGKANPVYISTGMSSIDEVETAINALDKVQDLYVMHCVSEYPLINERANLRVMDTLRQRFGNRAKIGFSDHTFGIFAAVAAVARGADVIEEHITLGHDLPGTDHIFSADPDELEQMVKQIRTLEVLLGSPDKQLSPGEAELQEFLRNRFRH